MQDRTHGKLGGHGVVRWLALALALVAGAVTLSFSVPDRDAAPAVDARTPAGVEAAADPEPRDPRARAFLLAYEPLIDSVTYPEGDVVFHLGRKPIHFQGGRLLAADRLGRRGECDPIFYRYPLGPLDRPLPAKDELPTYCTDVQESLWGRSEGEIREHGRSIRFLDHRMFVNELLIDPLAAVERDILAAASRSTEVADWLEDLDVTYSFIYRRIDGSPTRSHHAWGLAIDLVPSTYDGRHVYWRWSRDLDEEGWDEIPMAQRWSPPRRVVEIFERHGFVWGGKWAHFDTIHFEYRPEILLYNRMVSRAGGSAPR